MNEKGPQMHHQHMEQNVEDWFPPAADPAANARALMELHRLEMPCMNSTHLHAERWEFGESKATDHCDAP